MLASNAEKDIQFMRRISRSLDSSIKIPGTNISFGLDPIIGLVPFLGDVISMVISFVFIFYAIKNGAGSKVLLKMVANVLVDTFGGSIPFVGWLFDFFFKSNKKNMELFEEHFIEKKHQGSAKGTLILICLILLALIVLIIYLLSLILSFFAGLLPDMYNGFMEFFS